MDFAFNILLFFRWRSIRNERRCRDKPYSLTQHGRFWIWTRNVKVISELLLGQKVLFFFNACERGKAGSRCLGNKGSSNSSAIQVHKKLPDIPYDSQNKGSGIQKTRNTLFCLEFVCLFNWISQKSKSSDWESFSLMSCLVLDTEEDQTQNGTRLQCWNAPVQVHS